MRHTMKDIVCRQTAEAYYEANCEAYSVGIQKNLFSNKLVIKNFSIFF